MVVYILIVALCVSNFQITFQAALGTALLENRAIFTNEYKEKRAELPSVAKT